MIPDAVFTLDKAKAHLRVVHDEEDALITAFLDAAVAECERITRRAWTKRQWATAIGRDELDTCGSCEAAVLHAELSPATVTGILAFPFPPGTALPAADFYTATRFGHTELHIRTWSVAVPEFGDAGRVAWEAEPFAVPADVYAAVMLYLGDLYENREAQLTGISVVPNMAAEVLLRPYVIELHA